MKTVPEQPIRVLDSGVDLRGLFKGDQAGQLVLEGFPQLHPDGVGRAVQRLKKPPLQSLDPQRARLNPAERRPRLFAHEREDGERLFEREVRGEHALDVPQALEQSRQRGEDDEHVGAEGVGAEAFRQRHQRRVKGA